VLDALEHSVTPGPFILGERFSAADVYIASSIGWGLMTKAIEPRPAYLKYMERMAPRPAFQRMNKQNEATMEKLKAES
jgi:glutathione S-transferase